MSHQPSAAWHANMAPHSQAHGLYVAMGQPKHIVSASVLSEVMACLEEAEVYAQLGFWVVGGLAYEAAPAFDSALQVQHTCSDFPFAHFHVYAPEQVQHLPFEVLRSQMELIPFQPWQDEQDLEDFLDKMKQVRQAIREGEFYQINLTTRLRSALKPFNGWNLFQQLLLAQPARQSLYMHTPKMDVLSLSPELFFRWNGREIMTSPMKGTCPVIEGGFSGALRDSEKDRAENVMIVDLLRNDLAKVCKPRSVQVRSLFDIVRLPTVEQMTSTIVGQTQEGIRLVDVFRALFPCGSVTGAPKAQAMKRIAQWEGSPRHLYCGALGVMQGQHVHFNVPIRTVLVHRLDEDGCRLEYGVGSGITWYSDALAEKREWWQKTAFLRQSTVDFQVLETLRLQDGVWCYFEPHLLRMRQAAAHFSFAWDESAVRAQLSDIPEAYQQGVFRGRWLLCADGGLNVEFHAMPEPVSAVTLCLASRPIAIDQSSFVQYKTTNRSHYDAFLAQADGAFDVLLYTQDGELTETCRCNVVVMLDGQLWTPAFGHKGKANLLPGVYRAHLLGDNTISQRVLSVADLAQASAMWLINSLRGWVSVRQVITPDAVICFPYCAPPVLPSNPCF
jgi:para-aminobenzoate synthetase / 4-amino-4-deoxychorismate lyase